MIAKKIKSASVDKSDAKNYIKRAQELLESMKNNLVMDNWNAAVIDGVHSAISANDAITVLSSGKRCTSSHHLDAVELLNQSLPSNVKKETGRLQRCFSRKVKDANLEFKTCSYFC